MTTSLDDNVLGDPTIQLMHALNRLPGLVCIESECFAADLEIVESYSVTFEVERIEAGWHTLRFLAWLMGHVLHNESVQLLLTAPPDVESSPDSLAFVLQGNNGHDPLTMASLLNHSMLECFEMLEER